MSSNQPGPPPDGGLPLSPPTDSRIARTDDRQLHWDGQRWWEWDGRAWRILDPATQSIPTPASEHTSSVAWYRRKWVVAVGVILLLFVIGSVMNAQDGTKSPGAVPEGSNGSSAGSPSSSTPSTETSPTRNPDQLRFPPSDEPALNLLSQVEAANPDLPGWSTITDVRKGTLFDLVMTTNADPASASQLKNLYDVCTKLSIAAKASFFIRINGDVKTRETQVDGSIKESVDEKSLVDGEWDRGLGVGDCKVSVYSAPSVADQLENAGVKVVRFGSR